MSWPRIRALNRVLCVAQTMVYVLNVLSEAAPEWVRAYVPVEWVERYGERLEHERLPEKKRKNASNTPIKWEPMGCASPAGAGCSQYSGLVENAPFEPQEKGGQCRLEPALPAAQLINSPYGSKCPLRQEKDDAVGVLQSPF